MYEYTVKFNNGSEVIIKDAHKMMTVVEMLNDVDNGGVVIFDNQWGQPIAIVTSNILYLSEVKVW